MKAKNHPTLKNLWLDLVAGSQKPMRAYIYQVNEANDSPSIYAVL
jgi:hypothetical protein